MHYALSIPVQSAEITAKVAERLRGRLQSDYYSSSNLDLGLAFFESFLITSFELNIAFD